MAGWLAVGMMPPAVPHPQEAASHPRAPGQQAGSGALGLHVPHCDFFNKCMDNDLKLCSLQSYSGHLLNENGIFLGLYPARL